MMIALARSPMIRKPTLMPKKRLLASKTPSHHSRTTPPPLPRKRPTTLTSSKVPAAPSSTIVCSTKLWIGWVWAKRKNRLARLGTHRSPRRRHLTVFWNRLRRWIRPPLLTCLRLKIQLPLPTATASTTTSIANRWVLTETRRPVSFTGIRSKILGSIPTTITITMTTITMEIMTIMIIMIITIITIIIIMKVVWTLLECSLHLRPRAQIRVQ